MSRILIKLQENDVKNGLIVTIVRNMKKKNMQSANILSKEAEEKEKYAGT